MRVAVCQLDMVWEDKVATRARIVDLLGPADAGPPAWDWLVLPEMTLTGFTMRPQAAELSPEDLEFFSALARERGVRISLGGVRDGHNELITLDEQGQPVSRYAKLNLYRLGREHEHYSAGQRRERFTLDGLRIVPAVCYDLRFPDVFWGAAPHTDVYVVIANWPARRSLHFRTLLRARAIENQAFVVGVNRTGRDPYVRYGGASCVYGPLGEPLLECGAEEGLFVCPDPLDPVRVARVRRHFPFLEDRKELPPW